MCVCVCVCVHVCVCMCRCVFVYVGDVQMPIQIKSDVLVKPFNYREGINWSALVCGIMILPRLELPLRILTSLGSVSTSLEWSP